MTDDIRLAIALSALRKIAVNKVGDRPTVSAAAAMKALRRIQPEPVRQVSFIRLP